MTDTTTRTALIALVDGLYDDRANGVEDGASQASLDRLAGTGTPTNEAYAEAIGADYICALEDGTIAAWGADIGRNGYTDRELVFIAPADQIVDDGADD